MNTDDLRDMLNEDRPEGLDGSQVLRHAQRARTRRRLAGAGAGVTVLAGVTAVAMVFSGGLWNRAHTNVAGTPSSPATTTTTTAPSTPATTQPTTGPATTPVTSPVTTAPTTTAPVTATCTPTGAGLTWTDQAGLMVVGPGGELVVTSDGPTATVSQGGNSTRILSLPERQGVVQALTDGRFVVLRVALTANSGDPGQEVWVWDSQAGGQASRVMSSSDVFLQVRDGHAMVRDLDEQGQTRVQVLDLSSGGWQLVHTGDVAMASLLDGGRYTIAVSGADGVRLIGTGPVPTRELTMYPPVVTNGSTWTFFNNFDPAAGSMVVWSPAMPNPLPVVPNNNVSDPAQVGANYALFRDVAGPWRLVDLRTGAVLALPTSTDSGPDHDYVLTADDLLLRDAMDSRSVGPEPLVRQAWVDLAGVTLTC